MKDKTVHESDRQAMMDEDCLDMFVNGQGICMGSGQVWLNDPNYMTDAEPQDPRVRYNLSIQYIKETNHV